MKDRVGRGFERQKPQHRLLRARWAGPAACLLMLAGLLGGAPSPATAATGFSFTPSKTEPYAVCGRPTPGHAACLAIILPRTTVLSTPAVLGPVSPALAASSFPGGGVGEGYDPAELQEAYDLPSASAGSGQTVAIVDAYDDPNAESDLATYRSHYGLSACTAANGCFKKVNQSGETTKYPKAEAGWAVEISLDLDMASAACPNCHILLVEATNNEDSSLYAAEDEAVTLGASEVSNSWGGEEYSGETSSDSYFHHAGVPITASAGDDGYEVEYPAASQYVIAVGGTALTKATNSRGWTETAWSGTGSGCSKYEPKPSWQAANALCEKRTNNDVAAVASTETPVSVADSYELPKEFSIGDPGWTLVGGTSVSSPLIAGTMALANNYTKSFGGASALYKAVAQNPAGINDVTSGNNWEFIKKAKEKPKSCGDYLCIAGTGYDGPTGLGSPNGAPGYPPTVVTKAASSVTQTAATLNATVNPEGAEVTKCEFEYGETTSYGKTVSCSSQPGSGSSPVAVSASLAGLQANTTYHFRISATNSVGTSKGSDESFKTTPNAPTVVTKAASEVKQTTAALNATVNPSGAEVSKCEFEYGETASYGKTASCASLPGSGTSPVAVSASPTGLTANTTYHFRISATNASGTSKGSDETFKALPNAPTVITKAASSITHAGASLNATVNPSGGNVEKCEFEYGETSAYGKSASCASLPGSGTSPVEVSVSLTELSASTTYHFRVSATNAGGTSKGSDETFKTLPNCDAEGYCATFTAPNDIEGSLKEPDAVALDPNGNTWVADSGHDRVLEFNAKHEFLRQFGSEGSAEGQFQGIRGIATNSEGDVYVSDYGNDRVQEFSPTGAFIRKFGSAGTEKGQLLEPTGIAVDASGNVWVLSSYGVPVQEFSPEGKFLSSFGTQGKGSGQIQGAAALVVSGGNLYISEWSNQRVQEFSTAGSFVRAFDEAGSGTGKSKLPWGIAAEPSTGDLYVSEVGNDRVQEFSPSGAFIVAFGSQGSGAEQLSQPKGIAVGSSGAIMVADTANNRIEQWSSGEPPTYRAAFTAPDDIEGSLKEPDAVALDPSGNTWVADSGHDRVLEFNAKHEFLRQFGSEGTAEGQFQGIRGIATNSEGDVYVSDYGNDRVQEFSPTGAFIRKFGSAGTEKGQLLEPTGIAVDASGNVWVLSSYGVPVQEFSSTGAYISSFGTQGTEAGQFEGPEGLAVSGGDVYVSESSNQRIQEFSTAGTFVRAFDEAGSGTGKSSLPWGIATEPSTGNLYVSEVGNDRVQEFSPSGAFIAAFGSAGSGAGQLSYPRGLTVSSTGIILLADTGNDRIEEWLLP